MKCRWGNLLMNMAVNFKFGCACAGNLQWLMSVISVASEFGSVLRWVVKMLINVFFTFVEYFWWILCFLLQPKFTWDGTLAINFLVQAQWCWFLISSRSTMSIYYYTYHGSRQELSHCCIYAMYVVEWCEGCTYWPACKNSRPILRLRFFIQICFAWECRIVIS